MTDTPYTCMSFFSGALGLDLGLEAAGIRHLCVNEIDRKTCETIRQNRPDWKLYAGDIRDLTAERLLADHGLQSGELFMMCGGPPCQAFSTAGKRLGLNDERGNVFLHFIDLIGGIRPRYAVIENVRGLLSASLVHRPLEQRGKGHPPLTHEEQPGGALQFIIAHLEQQGYTVSFELYNTANFGVPQVRERLVLFCSRDGATIPAMNPTHDAKGRDGMQPWRTLREVIDDLAGPGECMKYPERRLHYFRMLGPGQNWRDLPAEIIPEAMGKAYFAAGGKVGFFRRLAWDRPAPTVVTCPTMPATDLAHPCEDRPLSVQEYARIQTFPDDWRFAGSLADRYKQIGNAVPVEFGKVVGQHLLAYHTGTLSAQRKTVPTSRYKKTDHHSWRSSLTLPAENVQGELVF